jgi:hypothetical protein
LGSLSDKAAGAETKAQSALDKSSLAETKADTAGTAAGKALDKSNEANDTAGQASTLAKSAQSKAEDISTRLNKAADQLAQVERRVRTQGPRWQSLEDNKSEFIESLKPFAGSVTTVKCGPMASHEQIRVEGDLFNFLGKEGAGWKTTDTYWSQCSTFGFWGFLVIWNESASSGVNNSGTAVMSALWKLSFPAFGFRTTRSTMGPLGASADSPFAKAASDPTTIFVVVAPNSMEDEDEFLHPKNANKPKAK